MCHGCDPVVLRILLMWTKIDLIEDCEERGARQAGGLSFFKD